MALKLGDYVIYTRFGTDFKVGPVTKIFPERRGSDGIDMPGGYEFNLEFVFGIEITGGDKTQQLSEMADVIITTKEEWPKEVIKKVFE
jgi:hypothetical protein